MYRAGRFFLNAEEIEPILTLHAKSAKGRQGHPINDIPLAGLRSVAWHEDNLRVGLFGYLLNPHQGVSDAIVFEMTQQPELEDENWYRQSIELKVDFKHFGRSVHLLVLDPTHHQKRVWDEAQFVVVSNNYRILPSRLVFVPLPAHIASKIR